MKMQGAKWGVVVIMLALVGAVIGSYVMSMDVIEKEVTKYNPLADMTGEFDREQTPEYVEYNPSTNYTGYYTDASIIGGIRYFDGVDYQRSQAGNNFRLNMPPTASDSGSVTLTGINTISGYSASFYDVDPSSPDGFSYKNIGAKKSALSDILTEIGTQDWDIIKIVSNENLNDVVNTAGQDSSFRWIVFTSAGDWVTNNTNGHFLYLGSEDAVQNCDISYLQPYLTGKVTVRAPYLAASVDLTTRAVSLFYDKEMTQVGAIISIEDVIVLYDAWPNASGNIKQIDLLDTVDYSRYVNAAPTYMDPSAGVELE